MLFIYKIIVFNLLKIYINMQLIFPSRTISNSHKLWRF